MATFDYRNVLNNVTEQVTELPHMNYLLEECYVTVYGGILRHIVERTIHHRIYGIHNEHHDNDHPTNDHRTNGHGANGHGVNRHSINSNDKVIHRAIHNYIINGGHVDMYVQSPLHGITGHVERMYDYLTDTGCLVYWVGTDCHYMVGINNRVPYGTKCILYPFDGGNIFEGCYVVKVPYHDTYIYYQIRSSSYAEECLHTDYCIDINQLEFNLWHHRNLNMEPALFSSKSSLSVIYKHIMERVFDFYPVFNSNCRISMLCRLKSLWKRGYRPRNHRYMKHLARQLNNIDEDHDECRIVRGIHDHVIDYDVITYWNFFDDPVIEDMIHRINRYVN